MAIFKHKRQLSHLCILNITAVLLFGCGGSSSKMDNAVVIPDDQPSPPDVPISKPDTFVATSEVSLNADGENLGLSAYALIENEFSQGCIEAPDFYSTDHTSVKHIIEDSDATVGAHFVFLAHRDDDLNKGVASDRQRNEIKTYDKSDVSVKGYLGDTMQFNWRFKVSNELELSTKFSHFFQLKAKNFSEDNSNGNDNQPVITLSGAEKDSSGNELQVRYSSGNNPDGSSSSDVYLTRIDWSIITDEWLDISVQATFAEEGAFKMQIVRMSDQAIVVDLNETNIDMWRGLSDRDFVRPKWGIYRSLADSDSLRAEEEQVRFANFVIKKGTLKE